MIDRVDAFVPDGGPHGLGFIEGSKPVDPTAWFFKAHFYQDPVWPGSLGLESFLQLLKVVAAERWGGSAPDARVRVGRAWATRTAGSTAARCSRRDRLVTTQAVDHGGRRRRRAAHGRRLPRRRRAGRSTR